MFSKGPKYRLPSTIDFNACRTQIAHSIEDFSIKWCRREHADPNSLSTWKKSILKIIDTRINFYNANPSLLPPRPRFSFRNLNSGIQEFHNKCVLVPADKAANNVIIV